MKKLVAYISTANPIGAWVNPLRIYFDDDGTDLRRLPGGAPDPLDPRWSCSCRKSPCPDIHGLVMGAVTEDPSRAETAWMRLPVWRWPMTLARKRPYLIKLTAFGAALLRHEWAAQALRANPEAR